ncbi:DUF1826 domain-containing protein [Sagittula stellata]|uniref:DUF1826 domain-containing protein n=1 Tax=Sagittula stellata (strain ATCC 700073 / DSM 11524 / E-37) TaxID=388399 RepID=A3K4R7_SAGS3|nr:DUF1826 domain-containing protein [Sagittula stellata]EBA07966.1 hypothetical protein SSE37_01895 [Sagittula stellata E-37]
MTQAMIYTINAAQTLDDCVFLSDATEELAAIRRPDCAAAIWTRQPLARFQKWLDALSREQLPATRMILRPAQVCDALMRVSDMHGTPATPERDMLIGDASALAAIFADVMDTPFLRLRFDVVSTNACRKFHIDAVTARLVCTYRGTGTQYGLSQNGQDPEQIVTVPTGSPIVLRGTRWPETPLSGLLHRSPPIAGTGETRLLLVLDPIVDPEEEIDSVYIN